MIELQDGRDVLDIGCGAGREVLEAATRVGPSGTVYGLDMNDDMLALARENKRRAGVSNAFFVRGTMEEIPLPPETVDVVISNCVINLSHDKDKVLSELYRVLKPAGRLAISDTVLEGKPAPAAKDDMDLWCSCISGAMEPDEYAARLTDAGFVDVSVRVTSWHGEVDGLGDGVRLGSAFISAARPKDTSNK
jgi:SAM-dependent methyltransferase